MKNFLTLLLGFAMIGYLIYVVVQLLQAIQGDISWEDISLHLVVFGIFVVLFVVGYVAGKREKAREDPTVSSESSPEKQEPTEAYNPYLDKLQFGVVYRQEVKTWWYDSDGDQHDEGTIHASLRFYEDGMVIGVRSAGFPKREVADSFTLKGSWLVEKNRLSVSLEKIVDIDDTVDIYISPDDQRQMKYAGHIADDDSLIKAGTYEGRIRGSALSIGRFSFTPVPVSTLIITADESTCHRLDTRLSSHPLVMDTFQDSGYWYTNGETGPEWFTVHIQTGTHQTEAVDELVHQTLQEMGESANNLYWG